MVWDDKLLDSVDACFDVIICKNVKKKKTKVISVQKNKFHVLLNSQTIVNKKKHTSEKTEPVSLCANEEVTQRNLLHTQSRK